tara:strand:- start:319 stop:756 length:438 start_codon:yes stop_codon:yes gene_type:complete
MTTTMDELNAQIEDLEEQVQQLRNEKVKRKLFNHFDIQEEDLEGITNFRLQSSYTSWEAVHNEYATGKKGTIELTFTRNNKEVGFSMSFVRETPSFDGYDMNCYGTSETMDTHYVNESEDPLIKKILGSPDQEEIEENWEDLLKH